MRWVVCGGLVSFFFSRRRRHTRLVSDWSSDVCSSDLELLRRVLDCGLCEGNSCDGGSSSAFSAVRQLPRGRSWLERSKERESGGVGKGGRCAGGGGR